VELGGTDQRFNLLVGRDLQKAYGMQPQCVLTMPLLEGLDGVQKMSKSLNNYIGIEDSPREMFGKTMKISDELMVCYYELLSDLTTDGMATLKKELASGVKHPRDAKVELGHFFVSRFHDKKAAENAVEEFHRVFVDKGLPDHMPEFNVDPAKDVWICHLLKNSGLVQSTSEARRLVRGRAIEWAGSKVEDEQLKLTLKPGEEAVLKAGKKNFVKIRVME